MNFFFNYIFFRIAQLRFKRDGSTAGTAVTLVSLLQTFLIEFLLQPTLMCFINKNDLAVHAKQLGWLAGIIFIILLILNYRKYAEKYDKYNLYWKDENSKKRLFKGILVILCFILPAVLIILINNRLHRN